jgi:hypothetical protein
MSNLSLRLPLNIAGRSENSDTGEKIQKFSFLLCQFSILRSPAFLPSKTVSVHEQTPIKLPFKDTTNRSSELQLLKGADNELSKSAAKLKARENKREPEEFNPDHHEVLTFQFPKGQTCFCCGDDRKSKRIIIIIVTD